jgi:isopenicillin-N N-acyltransferase like protein
MKRVIKWIGVTLGTILVVMIVGLFILQKVTTLPCPSPADTGITELERTQSVDGVFRIKNNWLKKNSAGIYELYIEGSAFERGVFNGKLTRELIHEQEEYFIQQIEHIIPSKLYLRFLKVFISWFNRDLDKYIKPEFLNEIYGVSLSASHEFDYIGNAYQRILNYHAAHDMGHALQDFQLVECTSFSVWNEKSSDSSLIHGRNFDFYFGDDFAKNKIISFTNPDQGYRFMTVTWGGMIGAVSGMNEKGLSVTINAAKSTIPGKAKTPITILTREILQYAKNIEEAFNIASTTEIFVSESIMIGSAEDNKTAIIEKTPDKYALYLPDTNFITCTNHFQSDSFKTDSLNLQNMEESSSQYRSMRLMELMDRYERISPQKMAEILRNRDGIHDKKIGLGNEKAINQLIAHHSIIFKPEEKKVWISANPYQLGQYLAYDLDDVFTKYAPLTENRVIIDTNLTLAADTFLFSQEYQNYLIFQSMRKEINQIIRRKGKGNWNLEKTEIFIRSNPDFYQVYSLVGDLHMARKEYLQAERYYSQSLEKEVVTLKERREIVKKLSHSREKIRNPQGP